LEKHARDPQIFFKTPFEKFEIFLFFLMFGQDPAQPSKLGRNRFSPPCICQQKHTDERGEEMKKLT
jgi:hypothetical protein